MATPEEGAAIPPLAGALAEGAEAVPLPWVLVVGVDLADGGLLAPEPAALAEGLL